VLKFGTNLLTAGGDHLDIGYMSGLVRQVAELVRGGMEIIVVSSGAVAAGQYKLGKRNLKGLPFKQVLASVGQSRLMKVYEDLFDEHGITVAQALLTRQDISDRAGYLNARNTLLALMELSVVTVVNENDVVAIDELDAGRFGDNDHLSAMVASLVDADALIILSDIAGLYTADPHAHPEACLVPEVTCINREVEMMASGTASKGGTGGMLTKIDAARQATAAGISVIIASGREENIIPRLMSGEAVGTRFLPSSSKRESRQRWMLSGLRTMGKITLDEGAVRALVQQKKSLLAAGILAVSGAFKRGDVLDVIDPGGERIGSGLANYGAEDMALIKGAQSAEIAGKLGHDYGPEVIHRNNLVLLREV
jgi:glutamate 5-kinase